MSSPASAASQRPAPAAGRVGHHRILLIECGGRGHTIQPVPPRDLAVDFERTRSRNIGRRGYALPRVLGGTGIQVSTYCLGLGAMMFGSVGNPDHDDCVRIIHAALDQGINFVDTADMYASAAAGRCWAACRWPAGRTRRCCGLVPAVDRAGSSKAGYPPEPGPAADRHGYGRHG
jgi:hypothetical protein